MHCYDIFLGSKNMRDFWKILFFKWSFFSQAGLEGSGKNPKSGFFYWAWITPWGHVLSLKTFRQIPALSWAIRYSVFQPAKFASTLQKLLATFFQIFDIWWSILDIMDDFKLISRMVIFHLGEINNIMILGFVKKIWKKVASSFC